MCTNCPFDKMDRKVTQLLEQIDKLIEFKEGLTCVALYPKQYTMLRDSIVDKDKEPHQEMGYRNKKILLMKDVK